MTHPWRARAIAFLAIYLGLYHLYVGIYGSPTNRVFLPVHLCLALALCFLGSPAAPGRRWSSWFDGAAVLGSLCVLAWCLASVDEWDLKSIGLSPLDHAAAVLLLLLVGEAVRRTTGWVLLVLAGVFMAQALWARHLPGVLYGAGVSWESLLISLVIGDAGVFGVPVLVIAQYVVLFLIFGRLLQVIGAGAFFSRLSFALFGSRIGGPAKAAVLSSGLFGTLSGSGVSNVLTTGSFTIPMMIKVGYRPAFAGGVEASAAVGGAIMPPVMGAVAFMMAEFMGVSYVQVAIAAAIPAALYYFAIFCAVHFESARLRLRGLPADALPRPWPLLRREGYLLLPLATIVVFILLDYSVILVVVWALLVTVLISFRSRSSALSPHRLGSALVSSGLLTGPLTATCAVAGVLIGSIGATGVGFQISQAMVSLSGSSLAGMLAMAALLALILGTGLTASAVYITMVATVIPILRQAGVSDMAAHMFAFYFGVVSDITPPTALAAVTAAGIARSHPVRTMLQASRIGIAAFIVPFMFVYSPALLMQGEWHEVLRASLTASAGLACLAAALAGHAWRDLRAWERVLLALCCALLVVDEPLSDAAGLAVALVLIAPQWAARRKTGSRTPPSEDGELRTLALQIRDETPQPPPAHDLGRASAWVLLSIVVLGIGAMGAASWHARMVFPWLAGLAVAALLTLIALDLPRHLAAARGGDTAE
ncbi:MAG: TRAP transporter permease [Lautropia sp.]